MTYMQMGGGRTFDFINPEVDMIDLEDITNSLSHICRYNGHIPEVYSVLHHSLLVESLVASKTDDMDILLQALLHDATEAYVGDMVHPLKMIMPQYRKYENMVWGLICEKFDIPLKLHDLVKKADRHACYLEAVEFFNGKTKRSWHKSFEEEEFKEAVFFWSRGPTKSYRECFKAKVNSYL